MGFTFFLCFSTWILFHVALKESSPGLVHLSSFSGWPAPSLASLRTLLVCYLSPSAPREGPVVVIPLWLHDDKYFSTAMKTSLTKLQEHFKRKSVPYNDKHEACWHRHLLLC
jgi:hypothetical protein